MEWLKHIPVRVLLGVMTGVLIGSLSGIMSQRIGHAPALGPESPGYGVAAIRQATRSQMIDGAVVFIGDSQTVALPTSSLPGKSENFGISSDTVDGALKRISTYQLAKARAVVLQIGGNDLPLRNAADFEQKYRKVLTAIPVPVVAVAAFPGTDRYTHTGELNSIIARACAARPNCRFLTITPRLIGKDGQIRQEFYNRDGIHLSPGGIRLWLDALKLAIAALR